jgi:hypothetical protein
MSLLKLTTLALLVAAVLAACGSGQPARSTALTGAAKPTTDTRRGFEWLAAASVPRAWARARLRDGAVLAYPTSWRRIRSDSGSVSVARIDRHSGLIAEYLNVTPQQGAETLQNWTSFRPAHNVDEGARRVQILAAARDLPFRDGEASCVIDRYRTTATTYQEIACLVRGQRSTNVIVAAAFRARWAQDAPTLERAVSAFVA